MRYLAMMTCACLTACTGGLESNVPWGTSGAPQDMANDASAPLTDLPTLEDMSQDTSPPEPDLSEPDEAPDLPPEDEEMGSPPDPCEAVSCGAGASCVDGACVCTPGFVFRDGVCEPKRPGEPASRTAEEVCVRWVSDHPETTRTATTRGDVSTCDAGDVTRDGHNDAMRRVNLYRWLVGLDPSGTDAVNQAKAQQAALMMDANSALSHSPPMSWKCYTQDGAMAAGSSNLALGTRTPASTVDLYVEDRNVASLGHRRWVMSPTLDKVGFGHSGRGGAMWVFGRGSGMTSPEYVSYPSAGPFPAPALRGEWSLTSSKSLSGAVVKVTPRGGMPKTYMPQMLSGGVGSHRNAMKYSPEGIEVGETYIIEVTLGDGTVWSWETQVVSCD